MPDIQCPCGRTLQVSDPVKREDGTSERTVTGQCGLGTECMFRIMQPLAQLDGFRVERVYVSPNVLREWPRARYERPEPEPEPEREPPAFASIVVGYSEDEHDAGDMGEPLIFGRDVRLSVTLSDVESKKLRKIMKRKEQESDCVQFVIFGHLEVPEPDGKDALGEPIAKAYGDKPALFEFEDE